MFNEIRLLEEGLGGRLYERAGRRLELTASPVAGAAALGRRFTLR